MLARALKLQCHVLFGTRECRPYSNPADMPSRRRELEACHLWGLSFAGDIALPPELLASIVDGVPFPELLSENGDWTWVISQRGKAKDDNKDS